MKESNQETSYHILKNKKKQELTASYIYFTKKKKNVCKCVSSLNEKKK